MKLLSASLYNIQGVTKRMKKSKYTKWLMIAVLCSMVISTPFFNQPIYANTDTINTDEDPENKDTIHSDEESLATKKPKATKKPDITEQPIQNEVTFQESMPETNYIAERVTPKPKKKKRKKKQKETPLPIHTPEVIEPEEKTIDAEFNVNNDVKRIEVFFSTNSSCNEFKLYDAQNTEIIIPNYLDEELVASTLKENTHNITSNDVEIEETASATGAAAEASTLNYYTTGTSLSGQYIKVFPLNLVPNYSDIMYTVIYICQPKNKGNWKLEVPDSAELLEYIVVDSAIEENWENCTEIEKTEPQEVLVSEMKSESKYSDNINDIISVFIDATEEPVIEFEETEQQEQKVSLNLAPIAFMIILIAIIVFAAIKVKSFFTAKQLDEYEREEAAERRRKRKKHYSEEEELERLHSEFEEDEYEDDEFEEEESRTDSCDENDSNYDDYDEDSDEDGMTLNKNYDPYSMLENEDGSSIEQPTRKKSSFTGIKNSSSSNNGLI